MYIFGNWQTHLFYRKVLPTFADGNADVTRVRKLLLSAFKVSQQFFRLLTDASRVLRAADALA